MTWIVQNLWLIPALPMLAAGLSALSPQRCRKFSASLAVGSMIGAFLLSFCAFAHALGHHGEETRQVFAFPWLQFAAGDVGILKLGWVLDPLTSVMLVMVTLVGTLIFIYSLGYMAHDENFTRFFTFLSLFAGAMLGVVIANSLLLLFICWELVGLTSYLLIGFWYHKPTAAAAAKKAFITTRIGDVAFLLGVVWLYSQFSDFFDRPDMFVLQVSGESMIEAQIADGDYVVIRRQTTAQPGQMVVAQTSDGEATLKHWYPEKNRIRLQPANSSMDPIYVKDVHVVGVVVGVVRSVR